jgi:hypothetical protein
MDKAAPGRPLSPWPPKANQGDWPQSRYVVEQAFGTLKRRFSFARASYMTRAISGGAADSESHRLQPCESPETGEVRLQLEKTGLQGLKRI